MSVAFANNRVVAGVLGVVLFVFAKLTSGARLSRSQRRRWKAALVACGAVVLAPAAPPKMFRFAPVPGRTLASRLAHISFSIDDTIDDADDLWYVIVFSCY